MKSRVSRETRLGGSSLPVSLFSYGKLNTYALIMGKNDFRCAVGCSHEQCKGARCMFYRIPEKPSWLRRAWLEKINRVDGVNGRVKFADWKPSNLLVCVAAIFQALQIQNHIYQTESLSFPHFSITSIKNPPQKEGQTTANLHRQ